MSVRGSEMRVATAPRVAYQGEPGAYGEMAIAQEWRGNATALGAPTFAEALGQLGRGRADFAVIPVWNSTIGDIKDTTVLLAHHASRLETVSELVVPVVHCLLGLPGASFATVRYVGSHPTALAQCRRLFGAPRSLQPCVAHDTARRIVPKHPFEPCRRRRRAVGDDHHAGMLREADADAAAVMQ